MTTIDEQRATDDELRVHALIDVYTRGVTAADADLVASVFSGDAHMWGWLGDDFVSAPIAGFLDIVRGSADDESRSEGYSAHVVETTMRSRMAVVTFHESGYLGRDFTNTFTFLKRDGEWKAVSKTFTSPAR